MISARMYWKAILVLIVIGCGNGSGPKENQTEGHSDLETDSDGDNADVLDLEVGDVVDVPCADGIVAVESARDDESYLAVVYSGKFESERQISYSIEVEGALTAPDQGSIDLAHPTAQLLPFLHRSPVGLGNRYYTPRLPLPSEAPVLGARRSFYVMDANFEGVVEIEAECVERGDRVAVWVDRTTVQPTTQVESAHITALVEGLEATVLPRVEEIFGALSDIDSDGFVHVLYTSSFLASGVDSYVELCDVLIADQCAHSNEMEIIYTTPPELLMSQMLQLVSGRLGVMAHELQHLIYYTQKIAANGLDLLPDNPYTTEGLSAMAEDLSGYGNGNFFFWATSLPAATQVGVADLVGNMLSQYATEPTVDAARRAMGYLFWRYLFEQNGGNAFGPGNDLGDRGGIDFLRRFESSAELGKQGIEEVMGRPIADIAFDWLTTLAVSNRPGKGETALNDDPRFNYHPMTSDPDTRSASGKEERHGVDLFAELPMDRPRLSGPPVVEWCIADGVMPASGAEYLRIRPTAEAKQLRISVSSTEGDADLRLRLIRER